MIQRKEIFFNLLSSLQVNLCFLTQKLCFSRILCCSNCCEMLFFYCGDSHRCYYRWERHGGLSRFDKLGFYFLVHPLGFFLLLSLYWAKRLKCDASRIPSTQSRPATNEHQVTLLSLDLVDGQGIQLILKILYSFTLS